MFILQRTKSLQKNLLQARFYGLLCMFFVFNVLVQMFVPTCGHAARRQVIFQLSNLQQWIDVSYQYSGSKTNSDGRENRSARDHEFEQEYHIGIDYAILSRRLANGRLELDVGTNEVFSYDRTGSDPNDHDIGFGLEFLFDMVLFERRPYPVNLDASRVQQWINAPFADNYQLTSQNFGVSLSARQEIFPFNLGYRFFTNETSGLSLDRLQESDELVFDSKLNWWEISTTNLRAKVSRVDISFEASDREEISTELYDLGIDNILSWGGGKRKNTLNSSYGLRNSSGSSESRSENWSENIELQLGEGLSVGAGYDYRKNTVPQQERKERSYQGWAEHRLYDSLTTRASYSSSETEYLTGINQQFRSQTSVAYNKRLPRESNITLSYGYGYGENDRNLDDNVIQVFDEGVRVDVLGIGYLSNTNVISNDVEPNSVRVFVDLGGGIRGDELVAGDFSISPAGNQTQISIDPATVAFYGTFDYLVDYNYVTNESIEYSTETHTISAVLGLFKQRYRIYGTLILGDQDLIDGDDSTSPLSQQTFVQVGFEGSHSEASYGFKYLYLDTILSTDRTAEAYLSYLKAIGRNLLTVRLTERYSVISQKERLSSSARGSRDSNTFMLNVNYRKPLGAAAKASFGVQFIDLRGETRQDDLSFGASFDYRWYKFEFSFNADMTFGFYEDTISREDSLSLQLRRYF
ncbi:hypothetical protein SAMN02745165_00816 [Malonomonas rubra DSM 5091]|uniref:Uncharacterized protein n=1 Tax=Malonomonas rubra DSM 5091 TaxID=1122189 RepID=A0A1M6DUZ2_MALRU|nr:hypothetical protein [Malonomonas rubra]SHI77067.1 hypothetical protein SAMN02745165_00816 [Malonomonas rubra DSM 5091]